MIFRSVICLLLGSFQALQSEDPPELSDGQTVYVPAYSHIYSGDSEKPILLAVTLSLRNVNLTKPIQVTSVNYYDSEGKLIKSYVTDPISLDPLEAMRWVVPESDSSGGSGANFIVRWTSSEKVNPPVVESIMISARSQLGISFTSRGQVIADLD